MEPDFAQEAPASEDFFGTPQAEFEARATTAEAASEVEEAESVGEAADEVAGEEVAGGAGLPPAEAGEGAAEEESAAAQEPAPPAAAGADGDVTPEEELPAQLPTASPEALIAATEVAEGPAPAQDEVAPPEAPSPTEPGFQDAGRSRTALIAGVAIGVAGVAGLLLLGAGLVMLITRRRR